MLVRVNPVSQKALIDAITGNYPMLDLQQQHTGMISEGRIAQRVLATVVSYYPGRGKGGKDEALVDAGAIAFSKDTGPSGGYGEVLNKGWTLGRISQEHGILTRTIGTDDNGQQALELGSIVEIIGQHACLIAAVSVLSFELTKLKLEKTGLSLVLHR